MPKVDVALADLTMRDITLLGDGLMYCLKHELSEEDAVDRFALSFISMAQLREEHALFSVALERFCKRILSDQQKWAKVKLFVAAAISIIDTLSDITMIFEFLSRGEKVFAYGTLGCVFFNLTFQAIVTLYQNKAKPFKRQVKEQIYVWTLAKPGLDAWRVASESIHEEGSVINARQELTIDKTLELVAEAIPGTIIQLASIMKTGDFTHLGFMEYLHTFTSMQTSNEYLAKEFKGSEQDEGKMDIFRTNRLKWKKVLGNEVDTWLNERLPVWLEEDVEWLTDEMMSIIPDDMIESEELLEDLRRRRRKAGQKESSLDAVHSVDGRTTE
ncbi:hypothetical protein TrRE_jg3109 [Triparma retinervis]|uniref:Uncharacterized protein n=1 Tax=Triparma retinervis TaxID=2557542 RepID=A0A9W6ZAA2_9STRA|nr:hypothetical protein TrRE_jg3109 [Triparma retinervis]